MQVNPRVDERLLKYARLLIEKGVNIRAGQYLIIEAPVDAYLLVQACCEVAFSRKAKDVIVFYTDEYIEKERCLNLNPEDIKEVLPWQRDSRVHYLEQGACSLLIKSAYPYLFETVPNSASSALQTFTNTLRNYIRTYIAKDNIAWCIASYPNPLWAQTLFPNETSDIALDRMFDVIYDICRIRLNEDPIVNWNTHLNKLNFYAQHLDSLKLDRFHFTNSLGTDLMIGIQANARFSHDNSDTSFCANIPTEEISTSPDKYRVDGIVYASKPLEIGGAIIDNFGFEFKSGKIIRHFAKKNLLLLDQLISTDEGSSYLGELAFVPEKSPITQSGLLFFNTLYDENASCHLALGRGFPSCIKGCSSTDLRDWEKYHLNHSKIHVDFMFGTYDLNITAFDKLGNKYPIFIDGNFAF